MFPTSHTIPLPRIQTIAVVGKYMAGGTAQSLKDIADCMLATGRRVIFESETVQNFSLTGYESLSLREIGEQADAAIIVGGDGTMLGIARQLAPFDVPVIGVNQGRLGFMTDVSLERMGPMLQEMLNGLAVAEQRSLLQGVIVRNGQVMNKTLALNDVVLSRGSGSGMIELRVHVDGYFMYNQRSDGLIVATPTGSTAYALSAGGPILHPSVKGISLVPIAPHALSNRPIVVPENCEIVIEVVGGREANINFDMQSVARLQQDDRIIIKRSEHTVTFLHPHGWNYYDTLREKLHWNEYPSNEGRLN